MRGSTGGSPRRATVVPGSFGGSTGPALPRLGSGDPLRALAAIGIVVCHVAFAVHRYPAGAALTGGGGLSHAASSALLFLGAGLWVFFPLSGYVVARPFIRAFVNGSTMPSVGRFAWNRALRVLPALWVALVLVMLHWGSNGASPRQLVGSFTLTTGYVGHPLWPYIGQAWNLQMEGAFYVATPALSFALVVVFARRLGRAGRLRLVTGLVLLLAVVGVALGAAHAHPPGGRNLLVFAVAFVPGLLLACFEQRAQSGRARSPRQRRGLAAALFWGGLGVLAFRSALQMPQESTIGLAAMGGGGVLAGAALRERVDGYGWRWLRSRPLRWIGTRSYGIYLLHNAVIAEITPWFAPGRSFGQALVLATPVSLAATLVMADISWRAVERPLLRLRKTSIGKASLSPPGAAIGHPGVTG